MTMLKRLFVRRKTEQAAAPPAPAPVIPTGRRVYAIGDVHGRLDLLDRLLARIDEDEDARGASATTLIFLGDLIDRGPDSAGVIARALTIAHAGGDVRFLMGNHEEIFLSALEQRPGALRLFLRIGGAETLASYGVGAEALALPDEALLYMIDGRVPPRHRAFIAGMEDAIAIGDYLFVHAGIRPGVPLAAQSSADLRWIRRPFLEHAGRHSHVVVHGHTIRPEVEDRGNRIGIDTGAYRTGRLTALGIEGEARWLLQVTG